MRLCSPVLRSALTIAMLASIFLPVRGEALPLFARKYTLPCTACHLAFPRLNKFGMDFEQNGYRMAGSKGESPWESGSFPLSAVANVGYNFTSASTVTGLLPSHRVRTSTSQFQQNAVELHSAGTLAEKISFHIDNNFDGIGGNLQSGMAFVQFDDVSGAGALNLKAGVFDADIPYLAESRNTTLTEHLSPVTFDGVGVEANGTRSGWTYAVGLVNSSRTHGKSTDKSLNTLENAYGWLSRDFNGQAVTVRVYTDNQDARDTTKSGARRTQAELNAYLNHDRWFLIPGVTLQKYADADGSQRDKVITALLEGMARIDKDGKWWLTGRYELEHSPKFDFQGATAFPEQDVAALAANLSFYVNPNAKVCAEFAHESNNIQAPYTDQLNLYVHIGY